MTKKKDKIPQNIVETIKDIGENLAMFYLFSKVTRGSDWGVYKNFNESGTDILLLRERNNKNLKKVGKIKIEVKTRQRLETTGKEDRTAQFTLSENEWLNSDFIIGYWVEHNFLFVIPKKEFKNAKNKLKTVYKYTVRISKITGLLTQNSLMYQDKWELIRNELKKN